MATLVISYSRYDQPLVRAVVTLLKSASRDIERAVFWDADIEPGEQWRVELRKNIDEARQLFVFWCAHSSQSTEVREEFLYALDHGTRVVPVLLDQTPLSAELASISAIDLRQAVRHSETTILPSPMALPKHPARSWTLGTAAAVVMFATVAAFWVMARSPATPVRSSEVQTEAAQPAKASSPSSPAPVAMEQPEPAPRESARNAPASSAGSGRTAKTKPSEPAGMNPAPPTTPPVEQTPKPQPPPALQNDSGSPWAWILPAVAVVLGVVLWLYRRSRSTSNQIRGDRDTIAAAFSPFLNPPSSDESTGD